MGLLFVRAARNICPFSCAICLCPFLLCCDILYIQSREQDKKPLAKSFKKNKKKFLTNALDCAIIKMFQEEQNRLRLAAYSKRKRYFMSNTMKKADLLSAIKADTLAKLNLDALGAVQIDSGVWAIPSIDYEGKQTYTKVAVTAANPIATEKVAAFDLDDAVEKYQAKLAESAEKAAERKRKHDDKVKADADRRAKRAAEKAARDAEKA